MPSFDAPEAYFKTYFFVTRKGMDFHESDDSSWALDDDGEIRPDWEPPRD